MTPESPKDADAEAAAVFVAPLAITVVPSHNLQKNVAAPAVSVNVTVPLAYHVPVVPCATLGPIA